MSSLEAIALHGIGDFVLQSNWIANHKLSDWRVRLLHVSLYCLCYIAWLVYLGQPWGWFALWLFVTHFCIDSRRWCDATWPPRPLIIDQVLHLVTLALLIHFNY